MTALYFLGDCGCFPFFCFSFPLPPFPLQEREFTCIHLTGQRVAKQNSRLWRSVQSLELEMKHEELLLWGGVMWPQLVHVNSTCPL